MLPMEYLVGGWYRNQIYGYKYVCCASISLSDDDDELIDNVWVR